LTVYGVARDLASFAVRHGLGLTVHGADHVPRRGSAILAVNHVSALDPVFVGVAVSRPVWYMAKEELFRRRPLAALFRALHAFPVRRDRADPSTIKQTLGLLGEGKMVMMFPEGTRQDGVHLGPVRPGVGVLAARAGVPVVPVYLEGAARVLPRGTRWPRRHPVTVCFGPPMEPPASVLKESAAAQAFGDQLRQQWRLLRSLAAGDGRDPQPARADGPVPHAREEGHSA
jgi:1-acyl-sn-glycerol-3-phosphate acyltransferase